MLKHQKCSRRDSEKTFILKLTVTFKSRPLKLEEEPTKRVVIEEETITKDLKTADLNRKRNNKLTLILKPLRLKLKKANNKSQFKKKDKAEEEDLEKVKNDLKILL